LSRISTTLTLEQSRTIISRNLSPDVPFNQSVNPYRGGSQSRRCDAGYTVVRLRLEIASLFEQWLRLHFPLSADRTLARIRDLRDGELYRSDFATRMKARSSKYATLLTHRFSLAKTRLKFAGAPESRADLFKAPTVSNGLMGLF